MDTGMLISKERNPINLPLPQSRPLRKAWLKEKSGVVEDFPRQRRSLRGLIQELLGLVK
jgi:hypothetical protein